VVNGNETERAKAELPFMILSCPAIKTKILPVALPQVADVMWKTEFVTIRH